MEYSDFLKKLHAIVDAINDVSDLQADLGGRQYSKLRVYYVSLNPFELFWPTQRLDVSVGTGIFFKKIRFSISIEDIEDEKKARNFLDEVLRKA